MDRISADRKGLFEEGAYRSLDIGDSVVVIQGVNRRTLAWGDASIAYSRSKSATPDEAQDFANCILDAIDTARLWTADRAGKPFTASQPPAEQ